MRLTLLNASLSLLIILILHFDNVHGSRASSRGPVIIGEDSWTRLLEGEWMVDFYAPWCPACKKLEPEWKKFAEWSDDLNINIASADVTLNPGLSGRFMVSGLPTIYHVKDGIFRHYNGPRDHASLINFVEDQGWRAVEPVSRWWSPDTLQMSLVAYSFRISMQLRDVHNYLVEDVGLPYYLSYLLFALGTVALGTILGLLIVFVIDQFIPSKYIVVEPSNQNNRTPDSKAKRVKTKTDKDSDSDLDESSSLGEQNSSSTSDKIRRRAQDNEKKKK